MIAWSRGATRWALSFGALLCVSLSGWAASAQTPKVYVMETTARGEGAAGLVTDRIHAGLVDRLSGSPKIALLGKYEPKAGGKPANAALDEAVKLYNSGIGLLVAEDFEGSARAFQRAVELFEGNLADVQDYAILKDALLRYGVANFKAGYDLDARSALALWVTLNPEETLSAEDYPAEVLEIVAKERRRAEKRGEGAIKVSSNPPGAQVWLNGASVGQTPLELKGVLAGVHYLVVKGAGPFPSAQKITVRGQKQTEELVVNLEAASASATEQGGAVFLNVLQESLGKGAVSPELNPYLKELASRSGADAVVFTVLSPARGGDYTAQGFVFRADRGQVAAVAPEGFDAELANLTLSSHQLSQKLIAAILDFPEAGVVNGDFFAAPAVVVAPPAEVEPPREVKPPEVVAVVPEVKGGDPQGGALYDPTVELRDDRPYDPGVEEDDESRWYKAWWFWTGVSALVISGAAGGYLLLREEDASNPQGFSASVTW
jgi:hypothetical protein